MIKKYKRKPVEVEAIQWTGDNFLDIKEFTDGGAHVYNKCLFIDTKVGQMIADSGSYIVKGATDDVFVHEPDIFEATYEEAE